ncbi:DUF4489 domain-containing protein [Clostridium arbusti]|uniref:DUF4489 domain-containing protein n=1 Tax=Clostridium arbusti TaxID=1137848 RepID=UPI0002892F50|nr:DUF4489 domain-containing protein [Clostridium arbusti]
MNSWSRKDDYYDDDCEPCKNRKKDDYDDHKKEKEHKHTSAVLKCNAGSFGPSHLIWQTDDSSTMFVNQPIASVTIDTNCLCNPTLKVDFNGSLDINTDDYSYSYTFNFTLYRTCKGKAREALKSFIVPFAPASYRDSIGLNFVYAQCDNQCEDCCTYTLELTSVSPESDDLEIDYSVNGTICALAIDSKCC